MKGGRKTGSDEERKKVKETKEDRKAMKEGRN